MVVEVVLRVKMVVAAAVLAVLEYLLVMEA
jgi:hypothetical protein